MIDIAIDSTPSGADVSLDGVTLGKTPYKGSVKSVPHEMKLVLRLSGHKDKFLSVRGDAAITKSVKLDARGARPPGQPNRDQSVNPFGN
jgi:hypothetical protein